MSTRRAACSGVVAALLALTACGVTGPSAATTADFEVVSTQVWSGDTVRIRSEAFEDAGAVARLVVGNDTLPMKAIDATTRAAELPQLAGGDMVPTLLWSGSEYPLAPLRVAGYLSSRSFGQHEGMPEVYGYPAMLDGRRVLIGASPASGTDFGVAVYDIASDAPVTIDPPLTNQLQLPGMTPNPDTWVFVHDDAVSTWNLAEGPTKVADDPDVFFPGGVPPYLITQLASNIWFESAHHQLWILSRPDAGFPYQVTTLQAESVYGVHLSPDRTRAALTVSAVEDGVPVFDASTGAVAYRTTYRSMQAVHFSTDGARLSLLGTSTGDHPDVSRGDFSIVQVRRPSDGEVLATRTLERPACALGEGLMGRWLLIAQEADASHPVSVLVLDPQTLDRRAEVAVPASVSSDLCTGGSVIAGTAEGFLVYGRHVLARFSLPLSDGG